MDPRFAGEELDLQELIEQERMLMNRMVLTGSLLGREMERMNEVMRLRTDKMSGAGITLI